MNLPKGKCIICESIVLEEDEILCLDCRKDNLSNLFIKCMNCGSVTAVSRFKYDRLDMIEKLLLNSLSTMEGLHYTGSGFVILTIKCPSCTDYIPKEKETWRQ